VIAHHHAEAYLDAYLAAAGIADAKKTPLFRSAAGALDMVKRRAIAAALSETTCNHTLRAVGTTAYHEEGGAIKHAQRIANHESPKTTKLFDCTGDKIEGGEIERIRI
jgi:integrase/recombinase XerD